MTFTLMLILNIVFDVAIVGTLAFVMTRPKNLTPHAQVEVVSVASPERPATERIRPREDRGRSRLRPVLD
jgi:hypothetical protein